MLTSLTNEGNTNRDAATLADIYTHNRYNPITTFLGLGSPDIAIYSPFSSPSWKNPDPSYFPISCDKDLT